MAEPLHVFISYRRVDLAAVERLVAELSELEDRGWVSHWYDKHLQGGQAYNPPIDREIAKADVMAIIITPEFLKSEACKRELAQAEDRIKRGECQLLPILYADTPGWEEHEIAGDQLQNLHVLPGSKTSILSSPDAENAWEIVQNEILRAAKKKQGQAAAIDTKTMLADVGGFIMDVLEWRFVIEEWNFYYSNVDSDAEEGLVGTVKQKRKGNQLEFFGCTSGGTPRTTASITFKPGTRRILYEMTNPTKQKYYEFDLTVSDFDNVVLTKAYAHPDVPKPEASMTLSEFVDFIIKDAFRFQKKRHAQGKGAAKKASPKKRAPKKRAARKRRARG